jgi:nucleotide-binding universal stress UspA family protein
MGRGPVLICYDGSAEAQAAFSVADLVAEREVIVLTVWHPFQPGARRDSPVILTLLEDPAELDRREEEQGRATAEEGAELARDAGFAAEARVVASTGDTAEAILAFADEVDASLLLLGCRGFSGARSILLGSVADDVAQSSSRPLFFVPSPALRRRRDRARTMDDADAPAPTGRH